MESVKSMETRPLSVRHVDVGVVVVRPLSLHPVVVRPLSVRPVVNYHQDKKMLEQPIAQLLIHPQRCGVVGVILKDSLLGA